MITLYKSHDGFITPKPAAELHQLSPNVLRVDLLDPTEEERQWVHKTYKQDFPSDADICEIEVISRFLSMKIDCISDRFSSFSPMKNTPMAQLPLSLDRAEGKELERILLDLGIIQDVNHKVRLGLIDMLRLFSFLKRSPSTPKKSEKRYCNFDLRKYSP